MDTSGFYTVDADGVFHHAPNWVEAPGYELRRELKDTYTYPVSGWTWFDSVELARAAFGIPEPEPEPVAGATGPVL